MTDLLAVTKLLWMVIVFVLGLLIGQIREREKQYRIHFPDADLDFWGNFRRKKK